MFERLIIGNKLIKLNEVVSTNIYLQEYLSANKKEIEGLVVITNTQLTGKGQRGNKWLSEPGKNLTFSIFLTPKILVKDQFLLSKVVALGILDFLSHKGMDSVSIKWPNDIYYEDKKLSGILIENSIKGNRINNSVVGIGLNVNQVDFPSSLVNPTSLKRIKNTDEYNLQDLLSELLFFIEKRYLLLKTGKIDFINQEYLNHLYWMNERRKFRVKGGIKEGMIAGVDNAGKLEIDVNGKMENFDLKEVEFVE